MGNTTSSATGFAYAMGLALLWAVLVWGGYLLFADQLAVFFASLFERTVRPQLLQRAVARLAMLPALLLALGWIWRATSRRFGPPPRVVAFIAPAWFIGYGIFYVWYMREVLAYGPTEDSLLEWGTFATALAASVLFLGIGLAGNRLGYLLALGFFWFAGEEISWASRYLGLAMPEFFAANNYQQELNLHNFFNPVFGWAYQAVNFTAFLALTWARLAPPFAPLYQRPGLAALIRVCDRTGFWLVPLLLTLAAFWPGQEYVEEQWGLTGLFLALLLWRETRRDGAGSARQRRGG